VSKWDKFKAYWEELGRPQIEFDCDDGLGWEKENGTPCWSNETEYRIAGDRHWKLRLKWVNGDKKLLIEWRYGDQYGYGENDWKMALAVPEWRQDFEYREAKQEEITITDVSQERLKAGSEDPGAHYRYEYKVNLTQEDIARGFVIVKLDPFRIADIYRMIDFALKTVLKKCLCAGGRGYKDLRRDLKDIIGAAQRRLEMIDEGEANAG
jgi:hypothetical protein